MSTLSRAFLFLLTAFAVAPLAGCGGGDSNCADICKASLACTEGSSCVLADPSGAQSACIDRCQIGIEALTPAESALVDACFACLVTATPAGQCSQNGVGHACDSVCNSKDANAAGDKWSKAADGAPADPAGVCTNGRNLVGREECQGGGDATTCTAACCNGKCGATPDVAFQCDTQVSGAATCTCTAGKNKGKSFQSADACGADPWNSCNL